MTSEDLRRTMEQIGTRFDFGEYEIEAYLATLEHGSLTASEVADRTDIPQPRVYDTVRTLSDRGLVELRESRPMRVVAVDPSEVFPSVQDQLADLTDELAARYTAPARETEAVSLVKSRPSILRYVEEVITSAEDEVALSVTPALLERFAEDLAAARERDVAVELLLTPAADAPDPDSFDYLDVASVVRARRGITTPVLAVADGQYSVYASQDALSEGEDRYGVIFDRSALGFLVSGFFNTVLWSTADQLAGDDVDWSFPRRYASIRRCIRDLRAADRAYVVDIRGRDVLTGEHRHVEGRVVDTRYEDNGEVATLTVETTDGPVTVGGRMAAVEDVEAHEIHVREA